MWAFILWSQLWYLVVWFVVTDVTDKCTTLTSRVEVPTRLCGAVTKKNT